MNSFTRKLDEFNRGLYPRISDPRIDPPADPEPRGIPCDCGCGELIERGDDCFEIDGEFYLELDCLLKAFSGRKGTLWFNFWGEPYVE